MAIREPNYEAGEIRGDWLRDNLSSYPDQIRFKCVGHWDLPYYQEGAFYTYYKRFDDLRPIGHRGSAGNGYSGIWVVINPFDGKELEDYL